MAFQTALTSPNLVTLRGSSTVAPAYAGSVYVSTCPNNNIYTARVNQNSYPASFAQITYDTGSGTLADVVDGMTVLISHTNDRSKAFFTGRVRKAPGAATLYINETSADIQNDDYIFILDDFKIWDKLGREVSGVLNHDYEITFRQLPPVLYNLKAAYADWVGVISDIYTISFAPVALAATSGATISTWAWDVADGTITVGSASTQNITATFPQGFRWVYLTVTDSGSRTTTRKIPVWAHGDTYEPELLNAGNLQVTALVASGVDATITAFAGVDTLLDNTLLVAWSAEEIYQNATGSLAADNIAFVGRIRKHTDTTRTDEQSSLDSERQYTVEGALTQLARIEQLPYEMLNKATPTLFGQITNLTLWRGIVYLLAECSTFLDLHSLFFDDTTNTYLAPTRNPVGNILNAINDLAGSINSALQMNYSGSAEIVLDLRMATDAQRNAAVTVAPWEAADILDIQYDHSHVRTVGRLRATGGSYNEVSNLYATFESIAPGVAQDYAEGSGSLDRQVLGASIHGELAQEELNTRAGHAYERAQEVDTLSVTFPDGYHSILIPALNQWHTFTIADDAMNIVLDTTIRWLLTEVNITHNSADGTKDIRAVFARESKGVPGQSVIYPTVAEVPLLDPVFPPFPPYDMFPPDMSDIIGEDPAIIYTPIGNEIPTDGNAIVVWTTDVLLVVVNAMLTTTPGTRDVTPSDVLGVIRDGKFGAGKDFYLLSSDGTNSRVHYTEDIFAGDPVWTATDVTGLYRTLRVGSTQGEVYLYGTSSNGGTFTVQGAQEPPGYNTGLYFNSGDTISATATGLWSANPTPDIDADGYALTDPSSIAPAENVMALLGRIGTSGAYELLGTSGSFVAAASGYLYLIGNDAPGDFSNNGGSVEVEIGGGAGNAQTAFSDDFALTFAAAESVGAAAGDGGMDTVKVGAVALASQDGQVDKATTGGAWAAYGSALPATAIVGALVIPRYQFTSTTTTNSATTPEYLIFLPALDTAGESLYRVTSSGNTFFGVTPIRSSVEGLSVSPNCITMFWRSGVKIVAIAEFAGAVRRLCCSNDTGATWTFSGTLDQDAVALTTRKSDVNSKQIFLTNGPDLGICFDAFLATPLISDRNIGLSDDLIGVAVYG